MDAIKDFMLFSTGKELGDESKTLDSLPKDVPEYGNDTYDSGSTYKKSVFHNICPLAK
ncbi:MAG: hypothetical protein AAF614_39000 [Chloroflexota bacterium]